MDHFVPKPILNVADVGAGSPGNDLILLSSPLLSRSRDESKFLVDVLKIGIPCGQWLPINLLLKPQDTNEFPEALLDNSHKVEDARGSAACCQSVTRFYDFFLRLGKPIHDGFPFAQWLVPEMCSFTTDAHKEDGVHLVTHQILQFREPSAKIYLGVLARHVVEDPCGHYEA